ncbi:hypothetical protein GA707_07240 [Nostocoides sp. F2B08]|uniref:cell wall-binding repeat-containing protein n=1 Tax=Nostocoides sp. F2B08 TaxID=2653936 RepID=UPI0012639BFF|nr:cell wall-binding repeat-containing protein [Tetrasphaera sp. F2B08]KAB7745688.1 hypothetical protein GA707_07240 [Tetrasphaera sp. F2B08]
MKSFLAVGACALVAVATLAPPAPADVTVTRLAGETRYETAVAISNYAYELAEFGVVVASGADFPDALAAGAVADNRQGPLLLVPRDGALPEAVEAELDLLNPWSVYIAGGVSAVSGAIEAQLGDYALDGVHRLAGADRYATSAVLAFSSHRADTTMFLATGLDFPDALGGSAAAGRLDGALMLTRPTDLPESVKDQLTFGQPTKVVVLGGTQAVEDVVMEQVRLALPNAEVVRWAGATRYETAARVSRETYPQGAATVFLASGVNFPDALAGGPTAARVGAPLLLTEPDCVPRPTLDEIERLGAERVVVLGGLLAVSEAAANLTPC